MGIFQMIWTLSFNICEYGRYPFNDCMWNYSNQLYLIMQLFLRSQYHDSNLDTSWTATYHRREIKPYIYEDITRFLSDIANMTNCPDCFEVKYRKYANLFATWCSKVLIAKIGNMGQKHNSTSLLKSYDLKKLLCMQITKIKTSF